jgi:hypothetical protein
MSTAPVPLKPSTLPHIIFVTDGGHDADDMIAATDLVARHVKKEIWLDAIVCVSQNNFARAQYFQHILLLANVNNISVVVCRREVAEVDGKPLDNVVAPWQWVAEKDKYMNYPTVPLEFVAQGKEMCPIIAAEKSVAFIQKLLLDIHSIDDKCWLFIVGPGIDIDCFVNPAAAQPELHPCIERVFFQGKYMDTKDSFNMKCDPEAYLAMEDLILAAKHLILTGYVTKLTAYNTKISMAKIDESELCSRICVMSLRDAIVLGVKELRDANLTLFNRLNFKDVANDDPVLTCPFEDYTWSKKMKYTPPMYDWCAVNLAFNLNENAGPAGRGLIDMDSTKRHKDYNMLIRQKGHITRIMVGMGGSNIKDQEKYQQCVEDTIFWNWQLLFDEEY